MASLFQDCARSELTRLSPKEIEMISGGHEDCKVSTSFPAPPPPPPPPTETGSAVSDGDYPKFPDVKLDCS